MYGKMDSISCVMELTEILKNEPTKAKEYVRLNSYRMQKEDITNILIEILRGVEIGCYHPQYEQIMRDIQIELDETYDEEYQKYQKWIDEVSKKVKEGKNMKEQIIRFVETDVDGCGTNAEHLIMVKSDLDLTNGIKERLEEVIEEIKEEWGEWDTGSVVEEACERIFGADAEVYSIIPDMEIEF